MTESEQTNRPTRILLAEYDLVQADELRRLLGELGYQMAGPARDAATAMDLAAT